MRRGQLETLGDQHEEDGVNTESQDEGTEEGTGGALAVSYRLTRC